ncbi:sulfate adenylyltransferase [Sulfodiicoccus acidiphilus]|uniref:Sulfate adenylyltransferase n=1 Tax=Sulfodiicoccus acidiphilus TaxID=1670455 RepID=A0A348B1Q7_9CREN|nr:sulfate adenylyltransferase [Sulfodiicoccus acidiphilus]BBD72109.1 sulfate adenylyltransferase [Sulfodiicoccus acidiphilus]GGT94910.1 sulfate adenylyltransferase [Sulfodiicoccus acidiphilus]
MIPLPHGGKLVNRIPLEKRRERLLEEAKEMPKVEVDVGRALDLEAIADGAFSPLEGFMTREELESVVKERRTPDGLPWTIPILLPGKSEEGEEVALTYRGRILGLIEVEDTFSFDLHELNKRVFGTDDPSHPGVARVRVLGDKFLGGKVELLDRTRDKFLDHYLPPFQVRKVIRERGWKTMVGFQTRNAPHTGHEYVQKVALTLYDGLFVNPLVGWKKKGDFKDEVVVSAYRVLIDNYFPQGKVLFGVLRTEMRYAGPLEAVHHAIVRKNFGCSHIIVGRDHAGVGNFYHPYAAHEVFSQFPDLGITPILLPEAWYCVKCGGVTNSKVCPHDDVVRFSGTKVRELLSSGKAPPRELVRPEVAEAIMSHGDPFI